MDKLKNWIQENIHKMDLDEPNADTWDRIKQGLSKPAESDPLKNIIAENKNELEIETPDPQTWAEISRFIAAKKPTPIHPIKRILIYVSVACIVTIISLGVFKYVNVVKTNPDNNLTKKTSVKNSANANDTTNTEFNKNQLTTTQSLPEESLQQNIQHKSIAVTSAKSTEFAADSFKVKEGATVEDLLKEFPGFKVDSRGNIKRVGKVLAKKQQRKSLPLEVLQVEKDYDELIAEQIKYTKSLALYGESVDYFQKFKNDFKALENQEKELRKSIAQSGLKENSIDDLAMIYQQKLIVLKKLQNEINKTSNCNKNVTDTIPAYISL